MASLSIITTCKGRLADLKRSLPSLINHPEVEIIVVDYDCPDGAADYVGEHFPLTNVVRVTNASNFNLSRARNLGAEAAHSDYLLFTDADIVYQANAIGILLAETRPNVYLSHGADFVNSARGSCLVPRAAFERIEGYDELLAGYEAEDLDLYMRLRNAGLSEQPFPDHLIQEVIDQTEEEKLRFRPPDLKKQFLRGQLYSGAKEMLMAVQDMVVLPLELRKKLLANVDLQLDQVYTGSKDFSLEIELPDKYQRGFLGDWQFSRKVAVQARKRS